MAALEELAARLRSAEHVVVLTGAGVSAESGLPTFRDPLTGLWSRYRPADLATPEAFARDPELVWSWYGHRRDAARAARPNPGHLAIARLETLVSRLTLITQNVDELHRRAGNRSPIELHGSLFRTRCVREGRIHEEGVDEALSARRLPRCPDCDGLLRPGVVWFGETLPEAALEGARIAVTDCDVLLSVGTSHQVFPAAAFPTIALAGGATVAVINPDPGAADRVSGIQYLNGNAGELMPALVAAGWS